MFSPSKHMCRDTTMVPNLFEYENPFLTYYGLPRVCTHAHTNTHTHTRVISVVLLLSVNGIIHKDKKNKMKIQNVWILHTHSMDPWVPSYQEENHWISVIQKVRVVMSLQPSGCTCCKKKYTHSHRAACLLTGGIAQCILTCSHRHEPNYKEKFSTIWESHCGTVSSNLHARQPCLSARLCHRSTICVERGLTSWAP